MNNDQMYPDISGQMIDDRGDHHDASPYNLEVDKFATGVGELMFQSNNKLPAPLLADCFHACFGGEVVLHPAADPVSAAWWRDFFTTGRASSMRSTTENNQALAETAAWKLAEELHQYRSHTSELDMQNESVRSMAQRMKSIKRGVQAAEEDVTEMSALGQGLSPGTGSTFSRDEMMKVHQRLSRSMKLKEILAIAGGMMACRRAKKKIKAEGFDHVDGITTSGDLSRMLPSELMLLGDELTELNLLRRLAEEQTLALRKHSYEPASRGPIVVAIDESSSMEDSQCGGASPIVEAKAFALTMARIAQEDNRFIVLMGWSSGGKENTLVMPPDKWDPMALLAWLDHFYYGGTNFDFLLSIEAKWAEWKCPAGKTDVFVVTDTQANIMGYTVKAFNQFKQRERVKCYGLAIGADTGELDLICDQAWITQSMGLESKAVQEILTA